MLQRKRSRRHPGVSRRRLRGLSLRKRFHVDVGEDHIVQDVDAVDLVEFSDAVTELKHGDVVHGDPEGLGGAEDLHLHRQNVSVRRLLAPDQPITSQRSLTTEHSEKLIVSASRGQFRSLNRVGGKRTRLKVVHFLDSES